MIVYLAPVKSLDLNEYKHIATIKNLFQPIPTVKMITNSVRYAFCIGGALSHGS